MPLLMRFTIQHDMKQGIYVYIILESCRLLLYTPFSQQKHVSKSQSQSVCPSLYHIQFLRRIALKEEEEENKKRRKFQNTKQKRKKKNKYESFKRRQSNQKKTLKTIWPMSIQQI